jgi:hypothetical protein
MLIEDTAVAVLSIMLVLSSFIIHLNGIGVRKGRPLGLPYRLD